MKSTKKLGIIGGMGSRAGYYFLKKVIEYCPAATDQDFIEIIHHNNSRIPDRTRCIVYDEASPTPEIARSLQMFNENEVDVIALACNTSYFFYPEFSRYTDAIILHPVEILRKYIQTNYPEVQKVGLLATTGTINTGLFHQELLSNGFEVVVPDPYDQEEAFMKSVYMKNGLKSSPVCQEAVDLMKSLVPKLLSKGAEVIIGGCSEVPIVLNAFNVPVPFLDPMDLLAREAVAYCYGFGQSSMASPFQELAVG
jgi:aspartate racemase